MAIQSMAREQYALFNKYKSQISVLKAINDISIALGPPLDLTTVLNKAIDKALEATGADNGGILLLDEGRKELELRVYRNVSREFVRAYKRIPFGERATGRAAKTGKPVLIEDALKDPGALTPALKKEGHRSIVSIPLKGKDRVLGVITLASRQKMFFTSDQFGPLTAIGNQIGIAIENSYLHGRLKKQTERLEALQSISAKITSTLYLEDVLHLIMKSAQELLEVKEGALVISPGVKRRSNEHPLHDIRTEGFRTVRLDPTRKGPGKMALESRAPVIIRYHRPNLSNIIAAPLMLQDGTNLGILAVGSKNHREFIQEEARLLGSLASQAAIAIENALLLEEARRSGEKVKMLYSHMLALQEEDRKRISRELHDEAGQGLEALKIELNLLRKALPKDRPKPHKMISSMEDLSNKVLQEIRRVTYDLRPTILDSLGLFPAIRWYTRGFSRRYRIKVETEGSLGKLDIPPDLKTVLYRIVQESLTNIAKHSGAKNVSIMLATKNNRLILSIEDHGKGFNTERVMNMNNKGKGLGLIGIRERISAVEGSFSLSSELGKGTKLVVSVPLSKGG